MRAKMELSRIIRFLRVLWPLFVAATPVGGGKYQSSYNVFGLSLLVRLDKLW